MLPSSREAAPADFKPAFPTTVYQGLHLTFLLRSRLPGRT